MSNKADSTIEIHDHKHHNTEKVSQQLESSIENLKVIQTMLLENRSCVDVLNQLSGVYIRLNETRAAIVQDHIASCISPSLKDGQINVLQDIERILKQVLKGPSGGSFH